MLTCEAAREQLALDPANPPSELQSHLEECAMCGIYRRQSQTLDRMLMTELHWQAPSDLTARLLAIAAAPNMTYLRTRPNRWYVLLVYGLTIAIVALSLAVAVQFLGLLAGQLGLADMITELVALPERALQALSAAMPQSRYLIDVALRIRDQLIWLLAVAILWATVDRYGSPVQLAR